MSVAVQHEDFDPGAILDALAAEQPESGGLASFIGLVRPIDEPAPLKALVLEHYPGMTERCLEAIETQARRRWTLLDVRIIHRVGRLAPGARIVLVAVVSAHRQAAFDACRFIMDYLKTEAPFWKAEELADGSTRWVDAKASDTAARDRWQEQN